MVPWRSGPGDLRWKAKHQVMLSHARGDSRWLDTEGSGTWVRNEPREGTHGFYLLFHSP